MSKFDELCSALKKYREDWGNYWTEGRQFGMALVGKYMKYLEIPPQNVSFIPLDKKVEPDKGYVITDAIHIDKDTFFHLGMRIILNEGENKNRQTRLLIKLMFKRIGDGKFLVKADETDPTYTIDIGNEDDFNTFFDFLQSEIRRYFEDGLNEFLTQSKPRIGFLEG